MPNLELARQNAVLQNFFGADETIPEKEIYGSEGEYSITKDGENYSVSVLVKNTAGGLGSLVQKLEEKDLSAAIGDLGRRLIFKAARSKDTKLFEACLEAGASVDDADENGKNPLFHAQQDPANEEIVELILQRKKDPKTKEAKNSRDKFHELAALVRDAHLAGGNVQEVIAQFGRNNPNFKIGGLKAEDMTVFMKDISIKKDDNTPDLNIKPATKNHSSGGAEDFYVQSLLNGRNIKGGNEPDGEEIKAFYQKLLIACLEDEHRFISDEDTDNIRKLIAERAKSKKPDHDIGYSALNSVDKDSVAGLYMRALFEELKEREGLNENLTYEDFSRKLGDVVKINSKLDKEGFEGDIKAREEELKTLNVDAKKNKVEIKLKTEYLKFLTNRENDEKYKDSLDQNTRALNALLGSGDEKAANKNLDRRVNRDLKLTLNMMKGEVEFIPANILENGEREEQEAAIKLQSFSRGLFSRRRIADVREEKKVVLDVKRIAKFDLKESLINFDMSDDFLIKDDNSEHKIEEVKGEKIYNGNTGLVIHEFSGLDGLSVFTDQVEEANKRERIGPNFTSEVSIAHIKDLPADSGGVKNSFCIAVLNVAGATKIFSKKFDEITDRSSDLYKKNIKFETDRAGIEAAIAFLTEARHNGTLIGKIVKDDDSKYPLSGTDSVRMEINLAETRGEFSEQIAGLRKCLRGSELNPNDSIEEQERKRRELTERLKDFHQTDEGKKFKELLEPTNPLTFVAQKNIEVINNLLAGESTEEMKNRARQHTSRQMKSEIAGRVKSSMRDNEHKFNLDGLEVAEAVAKYQNQSLTQFSNIADNSWLGNGRGKKGFENLLKETMPSSAYEGISVFRPRGKDNIATVTFDGAYNDDDTMYLALPDSPQCYIRVSRCDKDGQVSVWRDGKRVREDHKKGDVLIDTGVVFHRGDDGKYERTPIHLDALEGRFGKGVKEAALDFKVKAISVNDGQRLSSAMLYNGKGIALELKAKSSPFREVDSHKPEANPEVDKLRRNAEVIFELVGGKAKASDLEVLDIEIGTNARLVIGKKDEDSKLVTDATGVETKTPLLNSGDMVNTSEDFKANLKTTLERATKEEVIKFLDKLFKDGSSKKDELINSCNNEHFDEVVNEVASSIGAIRKQRLEDINKKYAVIDAAQNVNLVIPVVLDDNVAKPKFLLPEIQLLDGTELKQMKIFDVDGKINEETKVQIIEKADLKFVQKFFSADEMKGKTAKEFLGTNYENLCDEMKKRCETAKVTVAFQKVVADGTHEGKPKYKSEGEKSFETFQRDLEDSKNIKSVEGEKASSKSFLLNKLLGRPTFSSNPKNTGR